MFADVFFGSFKIVLVLIFLKLNFLASYLTLLFYFKFPTETLLSVTGITYLNSLDSLWCPLRYSESHLFLEIQYSSKTIFLNVEPLLLHKIFQPPKKEAHDDIRSEKSFEKFPKGAYKKIQIFCIFQKGTGTRSLLCYTILCDRNQFFYQKIVFWPRQNINLIWAGYGGISRFHYAFK
jgi:hypothetical protein